MSQQLTMVAKKRTPAYRITDRSGVVHFVLTHSSSQAESACGQVFSLGRGGRRVWQLVPGHHHEICITCQRTTMSIDKAVEVKP